MATESKDRDLKLEDVEKKLTQAAQLLQSIAKPLVAAVSVALPFIITCCTKSWSFYKTLPKNGISFFVGFIFCFFGGLYPVVFAAVEAAEHGGRKKVVEALSDLANEALVIIEASKKDDKEDKNNDGVHDVKEMDNMAFMVRKVNLVVTKMNPEKVDNAFTALYRVWLAVVAVLTVQFARTITLAVTIAEFVKQPIDRFIAPTVQLATPDEYKKWVPVALGWIAKAIAMSFAWYIQSVISAVTSAIRGGLMMARAILHGCTRRGFKLGGMIPDNHEDTMFDEVASYVFAAVGFYFQFRLNFDVPFPCNLFLWPLEFAEYYLRWSITQIKGA
mmetsp:Transcript_31935/g.45419  ORF Transcript_31935/g.45419 Transcript_31935/m.45419 type:complete len:331 (+) Transcript_31935:75-1067(+)|eukprot:CAMPEP_0202465132 /NCGR_PEP_ID=MMETSP1360-20130828/64494_1 /ASSEMBLY_ACC=CAM_ASM_000848 /TAXON_ID=515479 /ORGANISM="Licmophora paradoxa, Strain CCMP2313" /LENGTH=330 /DNA_ID=CAMNT_0049088735 /DNA_START=18 /DNA_END=1010 /DNA_ORIENTATION=-